MSDAPKKCHCRCHGDVAFLGAPLADALEAAVACYRCRDAHAVALLADADYGPPKSWTPEKDSEGAE